MHAEVIVPATSANLGPGYDALGLALGLSNRFSAEPAEEWSVAVQGEGTGWLFTDARNKVAVAMARVFKECGHPGRAAAIRCHNEIPSGRGLGSSAAAIVGGMMLADKLCEGGLGTEGVLRLAIEMEGHPDNVAAAVLGGFTVSWCDGSSMCRAERFQPGAGLAVVIAVPDKPLSTSVSRGLLPERVSHADAAFNSGRAALLVAALIQGRPELLDSALQDRLHEPYRSQVIPHFARAKDALLQAGASGVALSGAGPTVIGLVGGTDDESALVSAGEVSLRAGRVLEGSGLACSPLAIDRQGARYVVS